MNKLFIRSHKNLHLTLKHRTFYSEMKNVVSNAIVDLRGSLIETLGKRMSKTDAAILNKYISQITNTTSVGEKSTIVNNNNNNRVENPTSTVSSSQVPFPRKRDIITIPENEININNTLTASEAYQAKDIGLLHPIFGQMICDLGYKMVYSTNVRRLALSPVWEKQRILRPERAARIANAMKAKASSDNIVAPLRLPGVITMYHDKITGKIGIVDGQHRVGALVMLAQQGLWNDFQRNILVDVFPTQSEEEVVQLFKEINSGEPVRLIDMEFPSSSSSSSIPPVSSQSPQQPVTTATSVDSVAINSIASETTATTPPVSVPLPLDVRSIITDAVDEIAMKYETMFKPTSRCRSPHLNADVLRDDLYQAEFLMMYNITSARELVNQLEAINTYLGQQYCQGMNTNTSTNNSTATTANTTTKKTKSDESAIAKAIANQFYLGLGDKHWIYTNIITTNTTTTV